MNKSHSAFNRRRTERERWKIVEISSHANHLNHLFHDQRKYYSGFRLFVFFCFNWCVVVAVNGRNEIGKKVCVFFFFSGEKKLHANGITLFFAFVRTINQPLNTKTNWQQMSHQCHNLSCEKNFVATVNVLVVMCVRYLVAQSPKLKLHFACEARFTRHNQPSLSKQISDLCACEHMRLMRIAHLSRCVCVLLIFSLANAIVVYWNSYLIGQQNFWTLSIKHHSTATAEMRRIFVLLDYWLSALNWLCHKLWSKLPQNCEWFTAHDFLSIYFPFSLLSFSRCFYFHCSRIETTKID